MIRLTTALLLLTLAAPAWAGWEKLTETDNATYYYDPATVKKHGEWVRIWTVQDLKQKGKGGELSERTLLEIDCMGDRFRMLTSSQHSGNMMHGDTLRSYTPPVPDWEYIPPGTIVEGVLQIVCK